MTIDEDFWDDLLGHLRERKLLPVVGPDALVISDNGEDVLLDEAVARRLAERYQISEEIAKGGIDAVVRAYFRTQGRDLCERLYRVVNDILVELDPKPSAALRQLAAVVDLDVFVSTTFDNLLKQAIDLERFGGAADTPTYWFSPNQSTEVQAQNATAPGPGPAVFKLFGEASSVPQYAIHDEDLLEWVHALVSEKARLPGWIENRMKEQPLLLVGCRISDWVGRFLVRMASNTRLSMEKKQFFIVGSDMVAASELSEFFRAFCSPAVIQTANLAPSEFLSELHRRWTVRRTTSSWPSHPADATSERVDVNDGGTIFISYVREDIEAAERLASAIDALGGDVWLDKRRLAPGDFWEDEILSGIRRDVRLFIPVISAETEARDEGYVFREWHEAEERSMKILGRRFIVPVVIDAAFDGNTGAYQKIPEAFLKTNFGRAPNGVPDDALLDMLRGEIRAVRRGRMS